MPAFDPVTAVLDIGGKILDKIFPDPIAQADARLKLIQLQQDGTLAAIANDTKLAQMQADVNVEEAKNPNLFIAGWRPFVGWVCGTGFAIQVLGPLLQWTAALFGKNVQFPTMDYELMFTTLSGMLGLGTMRTWEKFKNVEGNR